MLLRGIVNGTYHMQGKINSIGINLIQEKIAETETLLEKANASLIASVALTENKGLDFTMKDGTHLYTESVQGPVGPVGPQGVTWTPHYDEDGYLSWTNDGGLPCPDPVYIKGDTGEKGDRGYDGRDGDSGEDGYTPVKGVDYFTEADVAEIVARTLNVLLNGSGRKIILTGNYTAIVNITPPLVAGEKYFIEGTEFIAEYGRNGTCEYVAPPDGTTFTGADGVTYTVYHESDFWTIDAVNGTTTVGLVVTIIDANDDSGESGGGTGDDVGDGEIVGTFTENQLAGGIFVSDMQLAVGQAYFANDVYFVADEHGDDGNGNYVYAAPPQGTVITTEGNSGTTWYDPSCWGVSWDRASSDERTVVFRKTEIREDTGGDTGGDAGGDTGVLFSVMVDRDGYLDYNPENGETAYWRAECAPKLTAGTQYYIEDTLFTAVESEETYVAPPLGTLFTGTDGNKYEVTSHNGPSPIISSFDGNGNVDGLVVHFYKA